MAMSKHRIRINLDTEAIFGSGRSVPGSVDSEIVYDEYGLPYMKAKTFKGNLREEMQEIIGVLGENKKSKEYQVALEELLGRENGGVESWKNIRFSDCQIAKGARQVLAQQVKIGDITAEELKESLTDVRIMTSIDEDGSSKKGSLRQIRVIKRGLAFDVDMYMEREISQAELELMAVALRSLKHIGSMRTRGKGEVSCSLLVKGSKGYEDKTDFYIDSFIKEVKEYA